MAQESLLTLSSVIPTIRDAARIRPVLDHALIGEPLSRAEAQVLIEADEAELPALCAAAATLRDRHKSHVATYSRKVFIPLTTLCRDKCGYCTFVKSPGDPAARTLTHDEVLAIAEAGQRVGCKEVLFSLGERPELQHALAREHLRQLGYPTMIAYLCAMCELILTQTNLLPHANPGTLAREEIAELREVNVSMGMMLESVSDRLTGRTSAARIKFLRCAWTPCARRANWRSRSLPAFLSASARLAPSAPTHCSPFGIFTPNMETSRKSSCRIFGPSSARVWRTVSNPT